MALYAGAGATVARTLDGGQPPPGMAGHRLVGVLPPLFPERLGDPSFGRTHGTRFPYVVGEMARGISTVRMVVAAVRAGTMAFFGSAGLPIDDSARALDEIDAELGHGRTGWGANLIHEPADPEAELRFARLVIDRGVPAVSASAFMRLTRAVVLLSASGMTSAPGGRVRRARHLFAKVSRAEVARQFLSPAPAPLLDALVADGQLTRAEAELARRVPVAEDLTAEADSGGHTDNRPLAVLLPELLSLARSTAERHGYEVVPRVGAAGGLGTPAAVAAAFAMGAAFVLTGSINQAAVESGLSREGRRMLADATPSDVAMAPAADMFELGVKVQVLKRGTLFAPRASRLHEIYRRYSALAEVPATERAAIEGEILGRSIDEVWAETRAHFARHAPHEIERAEADGKHHMALVFRWYLFQGADWARSGEPARRSDYQIWCGPAMGAFNGWVAGSFLEPPEARDVAQIALNLLEGAVHVARAQTLRASGVMVPAAAFDFGPRRLT